MALQFNVSQLLKSDVGDRRLYDFATDLPMDLDGSVADDISGQVKFLLTNFGIVAQVAVHATLHLSCARCLDSFQTPTHINFEEEFLPTIDINTGLPSSVPVNDTAFAIPQNHTVDLGEAIRQNLLLAIDLIPVCSSSCPGLCPTCGANLNSEACSCPPAAVASPFAQLEGLLLELDRVE